MALIFKILLKPKESLKEVLEKPSFVSLIYALSLASIGSILSFTSLYFFEGEPLIKVMFYSLLIYILDILSVFLFGFYLSKMLGIEFKKVFNVAVFATVPVWISDVVDICQPLRPLSILGLLYSVYILWIWFNVLKVKNSMLHIGVYVFLYFANALISEAIFQNPLVKKILNTSLSLGVDFLRNRLPPGFFAGLEVDGKLDSFGED